MMFVKIVFSSSCYEFGCCRSEEVYVAPWEKPTLGSNERQHVKSFAQLQNIYQRIVWFYEAPVARFYYDAVSVIIILFHEQGSMHVFVHLKLRYSFFYSWFCSVMFFWSAMFHGIIMMKHLLVSDTWKSRSLKSFYTSICEVVSPMNSIRLVN